jgi:hypothetical protein
MAAQGRRVQELFALPEEEGPGAPKPPAAKKQSPQTELQRLIGKGKAKMNSAHLLGKFDDFTDEDWDSALILWWQCLAVFSFFGGAISAAVWA